MKRFVIDMMAEWKNKPNRKPLVIMGARQVGKTWAMKYFGEHYYENVAYISFYNNAVAKDLFEDDYDVKRILAGLNILARFTIQPDKTLIIFDEIQNAPKAFECLKAFYEDAPEYHIIVAGSLLGVALHEGISYPVGKVDILQMYPLNFREFLCAMDEELLSEALEKEKYSILMSFHERFLYYLKNYYYVGGMPAVVEEFRLRKDYGEVRRIQKDIVMQYKGDFGKHAGANELPRIRMVWDAIPMQLSKENKKFFFGKMKEGARSSEFEVAIQWLVDCGLVYRVYRVREPNIPLSAYIEFNAYKLFMIDIGLLCALSELDAGIILEGDRLFTEFKGALTEQYVLQQMKADTSYTPYYYGTDKGTYEQDFLIQKQMSIVPIEVKAEGNIRSQSLKAFHDKFKPEKSVRFSTLKHIDQGWMENIPLYAVSRL